MAEATQPKSFDPSKPSDANKNNFGQGGQGQGKGMQAQPGQRPGQDQSDRYGQTRKNPDQSIEEDDEKEK